MPDLSSVENTLVQLVAGYLAGTPYNLTSPYQPETLLSSAAQVFANVNGTDQMVNVNTRIFRGWPVPDDMQADLNNGVTEISIFSVQGMSRLLPGFLSYTYVSSSVPVTFTATVTSMNSVTFGGVASAGQITGIAIGANLVKQAFCIRLNDNDTPNSVAATLGAIIPGATVVGPTITIPNVHDILTGVAGDSILNTELARYCQMIDIHIWSPNPQSRDAVGSLITLGMAKNLSIQFDDGSDSEISWYRGTWTDDATQDTTNWHRYQRYEIPYPVVSQTTSTGFLFMGIDLNNIHVIGEFDYRSF